MPIPKLYQVIQQWWKQISPHYKTTQVIRWLTEQRNGLNLVRKYIHIFRWGIFQVMASTFVELEGQTIWKWRFRERAKICKVCGKEGQGIAIRDHIEVNHLEGIALPCNVCGKELRSRNSLRRHTCTSKWIYGYKSLGARWTLTSSWQPFGLLDFVLRGWSICQGWWKVFYWICKLGAGRKSRSNRILVAKAITTSSLLVHLNLASQFFSKIYWFLHKFYWFLQKYTDFFFKKYIDSMTNILTMTSSNRNWFFQNILEIKFLKSFELCYCHVQSCGGWFSEWASHFKWHLEFLVWSLGGGGGSFVS